MQTLTLYNDIEVYCVPAKSFPQGIAEAHDKLHSLITFVPGRKYFGISHGSPKGVVYFAAANELEPGELSKHSLEKYTIKKGNYIYIDLKDYMKNVASIGEAFQQLLADKRISPDGECIEWYSSPTDCRCMVRIG